MPLLAIIRLLTTLLSLAVLATCGYLLWSWLIPFYGLERGKTIAEWCVWIPFGGATIVALWWLAGLVAWRMTQREPV